MTALSLPTCSRRGTGGSSGFVRQFCLEEARLVMRARGIIMNWRRRTLTGTVPHSAALRGASGVYPAAGIARVPPTTGGSKRRDREVRVAPGRLDLRGQDRDTAL